MSAKKALGRGLDALIKPAKSSASRVMQVEIGRLSPNPEQPRGTFDERTLGQLEKSIRSQGILQPILVRRSGNRYEIVAGERRWRAAQAAGLQRVPVIIKDVGDDSLLEVALVENLQREDLNPVEEARAYRLLIKRFQLTQEKVAARVGKERATVANSLRLLKLPPAALKALEQGAISTGHAKAILSLEGDEKRGALLDAIVKKSLSVRQAEEFRAREKAGKKKSGKVDPDTADATGRLTKLLGLKVSIRRRGKGGTVNISFRNEGELQHLYDWIAKGKGR